MHGPPHLKRRSFLKLGIGSAIVLAGADAFLLKGCPTSELLAAVMPAAR